MEGDYKEEDPQEDEMDGANYENIMKSSIHFITMILTILLQDGKMVPQSHYWYHTIIKGDKEELGSYKHLEFSRMNNLSPLWRGSRIAGLLGVVEGQGE